MSPELAQPNEIRRFDGRTDSDQPDVQLFPEGGNFFVVGVPDDSISDFSGSGDDRRVNVVATTAERAGKFVAKSVDVQLAVDVFGAAVERNEIRINLRDFGILCVASEFAN